MHLCTRKETNVVIKEKTDLYLVTCLAKADEWSSSSIRSVYYHRVLPVIEMGNVSRVFAE